MQNAGTRQVSNRESMAESRQWRSRTRPGIRCVPISAPPFSRRTPAISSATSLRGVDDPSMLRIPYPLVSQPNRSERYCQNVKPAVPAPMTDQICRRNVSGVGGRHQLEVFV